jgi:hypothetical protein
VPRLVNTQKIGVRYFSEAIVEINEITLEEPNSNCKVVKIKAERTCKDCGCTLVKGTRCYTFNPRLKPRYWVCFDCLPEPTTSVEREVGMLTLDNIPLLFSNRVGRMGQHKSKEQITQEELEDYIDTKEELDEYHLRGLHFDEF